MHSWVGVTWEISSLRTPNRSLRPRRGVFVSGHGLYSTYTFLTQAEFLTARPCTIPCTNDPLTLGNGTQRTTCALDKTRNKTHATHTRSMQVVGWRPLRSDSQTSVSCVQIRIAISFSPRASRGRRDVTGRVRAPTGLALEQKKRLSLCPSVFSGVSEDNTSTSLQRGYAYLDDGRHLLINIHHQT